MFFLNLGLFYINPSKIAFQKYFLFTIFLVSYREFWSDIHIKMCIFYSHCIYEHIFLKEKSRNREIKNKKMHFFANFLANTTVQ